MSNEVLKLTKMNLSINLGINEARISQDNTKKRYFRRNIFTYVFLTLLLVFYSANYSVSLLNEKTIQYIPVMALIEVSGYIVLFAFLRAGNEIFNTESYEKLIVLPLKPRSIIQSRFLAMLLENELYALAIYLPAIIVYGTHASMTALAVFITILLALLVALFPLTVASLLGTLLTGLFARLKHQNLINSIFMMLLMLAIVVGSFFLSPTQANTNTDAYYQNLANSFAQINKYYFMGRWFSSAIVSSSWLDALYFALVSLGTYIIFVLICTALFVPISQKLKGSFSKKQYHFDSKKMKRTSAVKAFLAKDLKMYLNSRSYLVNTIFGSLLAIVGVIVYAIMKKGYDYSKLTFNFESLVPFIIGLLLTMSVTTSISLSFEGKNWWLSLTLPVSNKTIYESKILMDVIVSLPGYLISTIVLACVMPFSIAGYIFLFLVPLIYIVFSAVVGLLINIRYPRFDWNSENEVVKSSSSLLFSMLLGIIDLVIPCVGAIMIPTHYNQLYLALFMVLIIGVTIFLIHKLNKIQLNRIGSK